MVKKRLEPWSSLLSLLILTMIVIVDCRLLGDDDDHVSPSFQASALDWRDLPLSIVNDDHVEEHRRYLRQYSLNLSCDSGDALSPTLLYTERYIPSTTQEDSVQLIDKKLSRTWIWYLAGGPGDSSHALQKLVMTPGSFYIDLLTSKDTDVVMCFPRVRGTIPRSYIQANPELYLQAVDLVGDGDKLTQALQMNKAQDCSLTEQIARDIASLITRVSSHDKHTRHVLHGISYGSYLAIFIARLVRVDGIVMDGGLPLTISNPVRISTFNYLKNVLLADALSTNKINPFKKQQELIELAFNTLDHLYDNVDNEDDDDDDEGPKKELLQQHATLLGYFDSRLKEWPIDEAVKGLYMCPEKVTVTGPEGKSSSVDSRELTLIALYQVGQLMKALNDNPKLSASPQSPSLYDELEADLEGLAEMCRVWREILEQYIAKSKTKIITTDEDVKPEETRGNVVTPGVVVVNKKHLPPNNYDLFSRNEPVYAILIEELAQKQSLDPWLGSPSVLIFSGLVDAKSTPFMMDALQDQVLRMTNCSLVRTIKFNGRGHIQSLPLSNLRPDLAMREALETILTQFYTLNELPREEQVKQAIQVAQKSFRAVKWGSSIEILNLIGIPLCPVVDDGDAVNEVYEQGPFLRRIYELYPLETTILMVAIPVLIIGLIALLILRRYLAFKNDNNNNRLGQTNARACEANTVPSPREGTPVESINATTLATTSGFNLLFV